MACEKGKPRSEKPERRCRAWRTGLHTDSRKLTSEDFGSGLKSKTPRMARGALFYVCGYTTFYFVVKRNFQLFLFFLELVSFQEHSCRIPSQFFLCVALPASLETRSAEGGPHAALSESSELHAGSLGAARRQSPRPHRSRPRTDREARRAHPQRVLRLWRIRRCGHHRNAR